jgi:putative FmdB family regulatory protein
MPIFEYACRACRHEFEQLVRTGDTPACPSCASRDLDKLLSLATFNSAGARRANVAKARQAARRVQRDRDMADADEIKHHYGIDVTKPPREQKRRQ